MSNLTFKAIFVLGSAHKKSDVWIRVAQVSHSRELRPGSHKRHKHKHKINTKTKHDFSSGTCEDKTTRIFLCFAFWCPLGLCLDYDLMLMLMTILMSQAWLHSFDLPFVCPYAYAYAHAYAHAVLSISFVIVVGFIWRLVMTSLF